VSVLPFYHWNFFTSNHTSVVFLERLQSFPALPKAHIDFIGEVYGLSNTANAEIRLRFYEVALLDPVSPAASVYAELAAAWVVGKDVERGVIKGRMKFCRPVFRAVHAVDRELAISTYVENKLSFHPIARNLIEKVSSLPQCTWSERNVLSNDMMAFYRTLG